MWTVLMYDCGFIRNMCAISAHVVAALNSKSWERMLRFSFQLCARLFSLSMWQSCMINRMQVALLMFGPEYSPQVTPSATASTTRKLQQRGSPLKGMFTWYSWLLHRMIFTAWGLQMFPNKTSVVGVIVGVPDQVRICSHQTTKTSFSGCLEDENSPPHTPIILCD